jgi:NAD(P)-dependent dehydrogenase (short-subunit alcohol dehydrogenase family)
MPYFQPHLTLPFTLTFKDKTILITGASAGLGLAATKSLLHYGASEIIAAVRNPSKAEAAKALILDATIKTRNPSAKITIFQVDLEDYTSVKTLADKIKKEYDGKLDMVLLNAGTGSLKFEKAKTGHEKIVQVNLLSPALLAVELLPVLENTSLLKGRPSRLTWVGSFVQFDHTLDKTPIKEAEKVLRFFDNEENFNSM